MPFRSLIALARGPDRCRGGRSARTASMFLLAMGLAAAALATARGAGAVGFAGERYAVIIGVSVYSDPNVPSLDYADDDAEAIRAFLISPQGGGFEPENIRFLTNAQVDAGSIRDALGTFLGSVSEEDYVLVYLSGHGQPNPRFAGEFYFLPHDADPYRLESTAVQMQEILRWIGRSPARRKVLIADACHSGALGAQGTARAPNEVNRFIKRLSRSYPGLVTLTSSKGYQLSQEDARWGSGHGVFTYHLLQAVGADATTADRNQDKVVDLEEAYNYLLRRVMEDTGDQQIPDSEGDLKIGIPLAVLDPAAVRRPAQTAVATVGSTFDARELDHTFWISIKDSRDWRDFQAYLDRFGEAGTFFGLARVRRDRFRAEAEIAALSPAAGPPATATPPPTATPPISTDMTSPAPPAELAPDPPSLESGLGLTRDQRRLVQRALNAEGHGAGVEDGIFGPDTRGAIRRWQTASNEDATGFLSDPQAQRLIARGTELPERPASPPGAGGSTGPAGAQVAVGVFAARQPGETLRDCPRCPEMVVLPAGAFLMGSPPGEAGRDDDEGPQQEIRFAQPFALARSEVTFAQWQACADEGGCAGQVPRDQGWGAGNRPVIHVSWSDARGYIAWLNSKVPGTPYRLPSEAEWEYAARAGSATAFSTGATISTDQANYNGNYVYGAGVEGPYRGLTVEVDELDAANAWGLRHMHGNLWEWTEDCWGESLAGIPRDGAPRLAEQGGQLLPPGGARRVLGQRSAEPPLGLPPLVRPGRQLRLRGISSGQDVDALGAVGSSARSRLRPRASLASGAVDGQSRIMGVDGKPPFLTWLKKEIELLYTGRSRRAARFRYTLMVLDICTVVFFIVTTPLAATTGILIMDIVVGIFILLDFLARLWIAPSKFRMLLQLYTIADILVILSLLLAPFVPYNLVFLRVLRALRLLHSYQVLRDLRQDTPFFRRNEEIIVSSVNLGVFIFVAASLVFALQFEQHPEIDDFVDALYFTVTTLTTTGFGDIVLEGTLGRLLSIFVMVAGVSLFLRLVQTIFRPPKLRHTCSECGLTRHDADAIHCKHCGHLMKIKTPGAA